MTSAKHTSLPDSALASDKQMDSIYIIRDKRNGNILAAAKSQLVAAASIAITYSNLEPAVAKQRGKDELEIVTMKVMTQPEHL